MHTRAQTLPLLCCSRLAQFPPSTRVPLRSLSTYDNILPPAQPPPPPPPAKLDPRTVFDPRQERRLLRSRVFPIGSRRRRAALQGSPGIPFEQLPYQCFQEARKVLQEDRAEKIAQIEVQRARIQRLQEQDAGVSGGQMQKENRLASMRRELERLKILADINDPLVKKRFEDGQGDMSRPIYRHLAEQEWRAMKRLITDQRVSQMHIVPDILPSLNLTADVSLSFPGRKGLTKIITPRDAEGGGRHILVQPGEFVASKVSEQPPRLEVQVFDKGERFVTIAFVDPDVPDTAKDGFTYRCHFLASNIPVSPSSPSVRLDKLAPDSQIILPWTPPYAIKGSPYHRIAVLVLQQPEGKPIPVEQTKKKVQREGFILRGFADRYSLWPVGAHLFRTQWDEWMDAVMEKAGYEGAELEFRRKRGEKGVYKKKDGERYR